MATDIQNVWTGSQGELWLNNTDKLLKVQKFTFKQTNNFEDVDDTDNFANQKRLVGVELSGELVKYKVDFAFNEIMSQYKDKKQPTLSLVGAITNPDTGETKRISIVGITLNDMDIFAFEKKKVNQDTIAFNAADYKWI